MRLPPTEKVQHANVKEQKGSGMLCKSLPSIQKLRILCTMLVLKIHRIYENAHDVLGV